MEVLLVGLLGGESNKEDDDSMTTVTGLLLERGAFMMIVATELCKEVCPIVQTNEVRKGRSSREPAQQNRENW